MLGATGTAICRPLIARGLSVVAVAHFLGADSPSTTLWTYVADLWGDDNGNRIRSRRGRLRGRLCPECVTTAPRGLGRASLADRFVANARRPRTRSVWLVS